MPSPRVFVSSTCYDLSTIRDNLNDFINSLGYTPILSEYSDVNFDARENVQTSCLREVHNSDMLILIIGAKLGSSNRPLALTELDFEKLAEASLDTTSLEEPSKLSITQLEVLKAIQSKIPTFIFVLDKVKVDYDFYKKNGESSDINFLHINDIETAKYIFNFIDYLDNRNVGNGIKYFSNYKQIETHLLKQWSFFFQRLMREEKENEVDMTRYRSLSIQIEDLKSAVLTTIKDETAHEIARGVVKYRMLVDFLNSLNILDAYDHSELGFTDLLKEYGDVRKLKTINVYDEDGDSVQKTIMIKNDDTFYETRFGSSIIPKVSSEWDVFRALNSESRKIIFDTLLDSTGFNRSRLRHINKKYYLVHPEQNDKVDDDSPMPWEDDNVPF